MILEGRRREGIFISFLKLVFPLTLLPFELGGHVLVLVPKNHREGVELIYWNRGITFMKCDVGWNTTLTIEIEACDSVGGRRATQQSIYDLLCPRRGLCHQETSGNLEVC